MASRSKSNGRAEVLIIGAGASGSVAARHLAERGFEVICLEQGGWINASDYPGDKLEWELLAQKPWHPNPNVRGREADYPCETSDSDVNPLMFSAVGGSTILYAAHWCRQLPSDFRVRSVDGIADDWPFTYEDLQPCYERVESDLGVAGLGGDPAYPPGAPPPLPAHPINKMGRKAAEGMNKLGWHWWPGPNAISTQDYGNLKQCVRYGTCLTGCPEGAKASFDRTHWPVALERGARHDREPLAPSLDLRQRERPGDRDLGDRNGSGEPRRPAAWRSAGRVGVVAMHLLSERPARGYCGHARLGGATGERPPRGATVEARCVWGRARRARDRVSCVRARPGGRGGVRRRGVVFSARRRGPRRLPRARTQDARAASTALPLSQPGLCPRQLGHPAHLQRCRRLGFLPRSLPPVVVGYTAFEAGLLLLPSTLAILFLAARFGRLSDRFGPRPFLVVRPVIMAAGMLLWLRVDDRSLWDGLLPGLVLYGLGLSMIVAPITAAALTSAPERYSGLAAGVNATFSRLGSLLAIAILGVVASLVFGARTDDPELVPFALDQQGQEFIAGSTDAFRAAMVVAALLALAGTVTALGYSRLSSRARPP